MPLEAATYITDLNAANPVHTDPLSQADSQMRLIKQVLKNTLPNANAAITATAADLSRGFVPVGGIILWFDTIASIPANFILCDGTAGTPNLSGRFVLGAGGAVPTRQVSGSFTSTTDGAHLHSGGVVDLQGSHAHNTSGSGSGSTDAQGNHDHGAVTGSHVLTISEIPAHNHFGGSLQVAAVTGGNFGSSTPWYTVGNSGGQALETTQGGGGGHTHGISVAGLHAHGVTTSVVGSTDTQGLHGHNTLLPVDGGHSHTVIPPYVSLCFIMRVS